MRCCGFASGPDRVHAEATMEGAYKSRLACRVAQMFEIRDSTDRACGRSGMRCICDTSWLASFVNGRCTARFRYDHDAKASCCYESMARRLQNDDMGGDNTQDLQCCIS